MSRTLFSVVVASALLAACAQPRDSVPINVTHHDSSAGPTTDVASSRARDGGRSAGAGGTHAPGSTGLGSGTMGPEGMGTRDSVR